MAPREVRGKGKKKTVKKIDKKVEKEKVGNGGKLGNEEEKKKDKGERTSENAKEAVEAAKKGEKNAKKKNVGNGGKVGRKNEEVKNEEKGEGTSKNGDGPVARCTTQKFMSVMKEIDGKITVDQRA